MTYSLLNFYRIICEFKFDVLLICLAEKEELILKCVCVYMCTYLHVVMCEFACVQNNRYFTGIHRH